MLLRILRLKGNPMNRTIRLTFLALTVGLTFALMAINAIWGSAAQPATPAQQAAISEVLVRQQTAWNQGDVETFMQGYWNSPELTFAGVSGITRGFAPVSVRYKQHYPDKATMGHLDFTDIEMHSLGDNAALVLGKWHLTRDGGNVGGVFTLVFQKFPDGWKIVHDHTSQSPPPTP
jgi:beta-aspartyl-peptidase (threonine type)